MFLKGTPKNAPTKKPAPSSLVSHEGVKCDECSQFPINGIRYKCGSCADFDLCETCEAKTSHDPAHVFIQIRTPLKSDNNINSPLITGDLYKPQPSPVLIPQRRPACTMQRPPSPPAEELIASPELIPPRRSCTMQRPPSPPAEEIELSCTMQCPPHLLPRVSEPLSPGISSWDPTPSCSMPCPSYLMDPVPSRALLSPPPGPPRVNLLVNHNGMASRLSLNKDENVATLVQKIGNLHITLSDIDLPDIASRVVGGSFTAKGETDILKNCCGDTVEFDLNGYTKKEYACSEE